LTKKEIKTKNLVSSILINMKKIIVLSLFSINSCFAQTVSIDVGHSSRDRGATSAFGDTEFSYNQGMAFAVGQAIDSSGMKVKLIGMDGTIRKLEERSQLATGSDLFVSVHHDSVHEGDLTYWDYNGQRLRFNDQVKGFGIFVSPKNPYFAQSLKCAKSVANQLVMAGFNPNYYHNRTTKGKQRELLSSTLPVYRYDNLVVLKKATMPAILVESGVIINREEAKWIAQSEVRSVFAQAVAVGVKECMNK
jgi:N-acetylmuramoyl-L-alanine amidase